MNKKLFFKVNTILLLANCMVNGIDKLLINSNWRQ